MAAIKGFKGLVYNNKKVDIAKVTAPPYDVISPKMQARFYQQDPHNIIRLILGREEKSDKRNNNKYTRAKKFMDKWIREKALLRSKKESIYIYEQVYLHKGVKKKRVGFIALMKIEDPKESGILPHEYTLAKPKEDRLNLIKEVKANLSPVFSLFQDREDRVNNALRRSLRSRPPLFELDAEGVTHRLWQMDEAGLISRVKSVMKEKKLFIADGHHRYEVALNYRNASRKKNKYNKNVNYIMMYFSNLSEKGNLTILSTHRVLRKTGIGSFSEVINKVKKYFNIKKVRSLGECTAYLDKLPRNRHAFGIYMDKSFYVIDMKKAYKPGSVKNSLKTRFLKRLDVTILHDIVIDELLGIKVDESIVKYIREETDAVKVVDKGDYDMAFFLRPTSVMEMKNVAENGEMMPQKSTYFYPKLLTGLVINKF